MGRVEPNDDPVGARRLEQSFAQGLEVDVADQQLVEQVSQLAPLADPFTRFHSVPQRGQVKSSLIPAHGEHKRRPAPSIPGSSRWAPHAVQLPRLRTAAA